MKALLAWLRSKNITSHTVAVAAITLAGLITKDEQFRDFVLSLLKAHPSLGPDVVLLAGVILKYSHSSSPAGTVAAAQVIEATPDPPPPTQAAVDAAKPSKEPS